MSPSQLILGEVLANRCSQVLYRCLEDVGSTKGALYLRPPGERTFEVVSFYGWPRSTHPPVSIPEDHPRVVRTQRERRGFVVNDVAEAPELILPPLLLGRGDQDPFYSAPQLKQDLATLGARGFEAEVVRYAGGHTWDPAFLQAVGRFLARVQG